MWPSLGWWYYIIEHKCTELCVFLPRNKQHQIRHFCTVVQSHFSSPPFSHTEARSVFCMTTVRPSHFLTRSTCVFLSCPASLLLLHPAHCLSYSQLLHSCMGLVSLLWFFDHRKVWLCISTVMKWTKCCMCHSSWLNQEGKSVYDHFSSVQ